MMNPVLKYLLKKFLPRFMKKTAAHLFVNKLESAVASMAEENLMPALREVRDRGKEIQKIVDTAPKNVKLGKPKGLGKKTVTLSRKGISAPLHLKLEPSQTEQLQAERELESEREVDDKDIDYMLLTSTLLKAIPVGTATTTAFNYTIPNLEVRKEVQKLSDTVDKINKSKNSPDVIRVPKNTDNSQFVGQYTGESEATYMYDPVTGKRVAGKNKMVRFRNTKGFKYANPEIQAARFDNPLRLRNSTGTTESYTDALTGERMAVYDDPYYAFKAATNKLGSAVGKTLTITNVIERLNDRPIGSGGVDKLVLEICFLMNQVNGKKYYPNTVIAKGGFINGSFSNINDFIAFFKAYAWTQSRLNVSVYYLTKVYNAIYNDCIPPLIEEGSDWGGMDYWQFNSGGKYIFVDDYSRLRQKRERDVVSENDF